MLDTDAPTPTDAPTSDPNQHLYHHDYLCWVVHLPNQGRDDDIPHYSSKAAADRAVTEDDWWADERAAGIVLHVARLDSRCLAAQCADCGTPTDNENYHHTRWEHVAEQASHAGWAELERSWAVDHDTRQVWCSGCKVTRSASGDHDATDRVWPGPPARGLSVNVLHLLPGHLVFISPHLLAVVTARTTAWYRDPTATVHTDQGDYTVGLPCLARRVL